MSYRALIVIVVVLLLVAGVVLLPVLLSGDGSSHWAYHDPKGFRVTLPSDEWRRVTRETQQITFENPKRSAKAEIAANEESRKEFDEKTVPGLRANLTAQRPRMVGTPEFTEGTNPAGHPYAYLHFQKREETGGVEFIGMSVTWCARKEVTVAVIFGGPLKATTQAELKAELDYFERTSKEICLSVE